MRATLIHNPAAGDGEYTTKTLVKLLRDAGYEATPFSSKGDDWQDAFKEPTDIVIAAGGDGTVTKVAERLRGKTAVLALLPIGSANNIATGLGIVGKPKQLIRQWKNYSPRRLDFWRCTGAWGKSLVIEGCGLGVITDVGVEMHAAGAAELERVDRLAISRNLIQGKVKKIEPFQLKATCDGKVVKGEFVLFEMLNLGLAGPRLTLAEGTDPFDGLLDVVYVRSENRKEFAKWLDGGARKPWSERPMRCKRLEITWKGAQLRLSDNSIWPEGKKKKNGKLRAKLSLQRRTVTVLAPRQGA